MPKSSRTALIALHVAHDYLEQSSSPAHHEVYKRGLGGRSVSQNTLQRLFVPANRKGHAPCHSTLNRGPLKAGEISLRDQILS